MNKPLIRESGFTPYRELERHFIVRNRLPE
jgi:hypothetical protein